MEIKGKEGFDICWIEEGAAVSKQSIDFILPTFRKNNSEIIITFNIETENDPIYKEFCLVPDDDVWYIHTTYRDNKFFPEVLEKERLRCLKNNPDNYDYIWEGKGKRISETQIFKNKFEIREFDTPPITEIFQNRFYFGADWGFASNPTCLIRCFIKDDCLWIDYESRDENNLNEDKYENSSVGIELKSIPRVFDTVPESRKWIIEADNSRPETISYLQQQGFNIKGAMKWQGSVQDGIEYIRNFNKIIIHPRCIHTITEFKNYSYKIDKLTNEILPIIVDEYNHRIDSLRYSLTKYIKKKIIIPNVLGFEKVSILEGLK